VSWLHFHSSGFGGVFSFIIHHRYVKNAISVARKVLENTDHTLLVGSQATEFAISMGFQTSTLTTPGSLNIFSQWLSGACQPNYWRNVQPNSSSSCGPFSPLESSAVDLTSRSTAYEHQPRRAKIVNGQKRNPGHDTVAMVVFDSTGRGAAGTSTNGMTHKVPGRVGDSPIPGSGAFVDTEVGGCGETGNGDVMMRFSPCYQVVESMRRGMTPSDAAVDAIQRIKKYYPTFQGALFAINTQGDYAGAANGWTFEFNVRTPSMSGITTVVVPPIDEIEEQL